MKVRCRHWTLQVGEMRVSPAFGVTSRIATHNTAACRRLWASRARTARRSSSAKRSGVFGRACVLCRPDSGLPGTSSDCHTTTASRGNVLYWRRCFDEASSVRGHCVDLLPGSGLPVHAVSGSSILHRPVRPCEPSVAQASAHQRSPLHGTHASYCDM